MSNTNHLSAYSNQSQRKQIMHDEELSRMTLVRHFQVTEVDVSR
ncbi:unnamed protein product [Schistosoma margrebowiei]|uniref:Uncharacterized protein n=1 Tax=Schistosoma margrebowiei TaxID=48269 RepID=A0A183LRN5_9TREM|nr:unnamed protein product [Schistosoma margrebowiei]